MVELTPRLKRVYDLLGEGEHVVDVGCDHAYLAVRLILDGRFKTAEACDVAEGPLSTARENIEAAGLSDRIKTTLSDGLLSVGVPEGSYSIAVCGMGGELIASIIADSAEKFKGAKRIVLQPMTKEEKLREYLWDNGYEIIIDGAAKEEGHVYTVISAIRTGTRCAHTVPELYLGKREEREASAVAVEKLERFHAKHAAIRHSLSLADRNSSFEDMLVLAAEKEILYMREKLR